MRFLDISVERFGVLNNSELRDLSPGMTVVYGPNGSGKTTLVKFVEGLLFGYTTEHQAFQSTDTRFGGSASMQSDGRSYRVTRERSHGITSELSTVDLATGVSVSGPDATLPAWVNNSVFDQIFSVDDQEVAKFDLVSRLCLADTGATTSEDEIRRIELAISQAVSEREGNGIEGGLRQQISGLQRRREELVQQLNSMRQVDPTIPSRIASIHAELRRLQESLATCDQRIRETESRIRQLEAKLEELRRQNIVSLNRHEIEVQINQLKERQSRWDEIRKAVNRELGALQQPATSLKNRDSLTSIRALVSRLEQRMDSLESDRSLQDATGAGRDVFINHIRSEVFSLCDYVAQHESAVQSQEVALENLFGQRTLQDAENVNTVLQGQIESLRDELNRSEDIISFHQTASYDCSSQSHTDYRRNAHGRMVNGSIEELEMELGRLRRQLDDLRSERGQITSRIQTLQHELAMLEGQQKSSASLEDIDRIKAQISEIDSKLELLQERWNILEETERNLREVLARLNDYQNPVILDLASTYISRLTDGECFKLEADASGSQILARTRQSSTPQSIAHLSRGTREQVALALRLALIESRSTEGRCPMLLDDVFISSDTDRANAVADLLMEVTAGGQQIVFFTCQKDVCELFSRRNATVRYLEEPVSLPAPIPIAEPVVIPQPVVIQQPAPQPVVTDNTNWLFYLEVDNSIEDLSGLTVAEVEAIRAANIETINDLLTSSVDDLETGFRNRGYSISRDRIRAWRGQAELATLIPMLRRSDAELLYAAGIESMIELSRMRPETVYDMVNEFQNSQAGSRFRRSGRTIDRQQAINWSRWSQHSRTLSDARQSRSRFFVRTSDTANSPHSAPAFARSQHRNVVSGTRTNQSTSTSRRSRTLRGASTTRRQRRPSLSTDARLERERRLSRRRERLSRHSSSYRTASIASETVTSSNDELRFYLNRSDDVEAAPSIGPKTAQRLGTVGVYTVDDLLQAGPDAIASRLNNRRITPETIVSWQAQARLVCTVPELRGHDSQILVACGVTEAEQLAGKRPVDLFAIVGPFADTSEGERIVRGGKKPDLEEVTDWIRFAQQARPLKAAA